MMKKNKILDKIKKNPKVTRMAVDVELREVNEEEMVLEGYPLKFDNETLVGDKDYGFREVISKNALDNADMKKVPLKYNHDNGYLALASTKNGSLVLDIDDVGLRMKATLLNIPAHRDVFEMVKAGLLSECSFAFTLDIENGAEWKDLEEDIPLRVIKNITRLFDVSIVDIPAYENTEVYARSFGELEDIRKTAEAEELKQSNLVRRVRMKIKIGGIKK